MSRPFSATRLRASASFVRLTGISVASFDDMLKGTSKNSPGACRETPIQ
jgi:hypothetical protein